MSDDGRKIKREYENPFDNIFIDLACWFNINIFRLLHFSPNIITTISLIFGLVAALLFHHRKYLLSVIFFLFAYVLDCADGNYARMYSMVTPYGDLYDHISDWIKLISLFIAIILHPSSLISFKTKVVFFIILVILQIGLTVHLGCQEKIYNPDSNDSLTFTKCMCPNPDHIIWTRYVGSGTMVLYTALFIIFIYLK